MWERRGFRRMQLHNRQKRQARKDRWFRPGSGSPGPGSGGVGLELETRVLLSARAGTSVHGPVPLSRMSPGSRMSRMKPADGSPRRPRSPAQYSAFANDFATVEQLYVTALNEQATATTTVTATVMPLTRLAHPRCRLAMPPCSSRTVQRRR